MHVSFPFPFLFRMSTPPSEDFKVKATLLCEIVRRLWRKVYKYEAQRLKPAYNAAKWLIRDIDSKTYCKNYKLCSSLFELYRQLHSVIQNRKNLRKLAAKEIQLWNELNKERML